MENYNATTTTFIRQQIEIAKEFCDVEVFDLSQINAKEEGAKHNYNISKYNEFGSNPVLTFIFWRLRQLGLLDIRRDKRLSRVLNQTTRAFRPDIVHIQFGTNAAIFFRHLPHYSKPVLIQFRGYDASSEIKARPGYKSVLKSLSRRPHIYFASVSESLIRNLRSNGIEIDEYTILHTPIDSNFFKPKRAHFEQFHEGNRLKKLVQVGSFRKKKGQLQAIKHFEAYQKKFPGLWKLHFYGDGENKEACEQYVKQNELQESVCFHDPVTPEEVRRILNDAHAFIHLAITPETGDMEGIPNAIAEAMAMELPVITTNHSGIPELITNENEGLIIDLNQSSFDLALNTAYDQGKMCKAREKVCREFSVEQHKKSLRNLYEAILENQ